MAATAGRRVLIGTPAYTWSLDVRYTDALLRTLRLCLEQGIDMRWMFPPGDAIVQNACNELIAIAREKGFDDLIIIGSDQDWQPEWIPKLLSYDVDCVAGPVKKKTDEKERYNVRAPQGADSFVFRPDGLMTAPDMTVGTGFMRLSRRAMDVLWDAAPKYKIVGGQDSELAWIFDVRPVNGALVGEDIFMCMTLRKQGIEIWLDPTMDGGHIGQKRFHGNFLSWLERLRGADAGR